MFKNRTEYIDVVENINNSVTDKFDSFLGINIEFILKIQLSYQLHLCYAKGRLPNLTKYKPSYLKKIRSVLQFFYILKSLIILSIKIFYYKYFVKFSKKDIIFIGNTTHNIDAYGQCENLYLKPFTQEYLPKNKLLLYLDTKNDKDHSHFYVDLLLDWYRLFYIIKLSISSHPSKFFNNYRDRIDLHLKSIIGETFDGVDVFLMDKVLEYVIHKKAYKQLLLQLKPSIVQGYCFYENKINAMFSAANSLNIKTIEYQHSAISNSHFAYSKWKRVDDLYLHFPSCFYVWNKCDYLLIKDNFKGVYRKSKAEIVGIRHLKLTPSLFEKNRDKLLICLQGIWMPQWLESFLIEDNDFQWFIRLHPRYPNDKKQLNKLEKLEKVNLHINEANSSTLEELLPQSLALITCFSGTALEAFSLGIDVLIYGEEGKAAFSNFIEDGRFTYVSNQKIFVDKINAL